MAVEQSYVPAKPISSLLGSPRIFKGFSSWTQPDTEIRSPTSILDAKLSLNSGCERTLSLSSGIGLAALINSLDDDDNDNNNNNNSEEIDPTSQAKNVRKVLFGSKLKVQIPPPDGSLTTDFGIKTPRNNAQYHHPQAKKESPPKTGDDLSLCEMELSEDYTCVITHGPTPRTTHLFDDCIVESCCGIVRLSELKKDNNGFRTHHQPSSPPVGFCHTCTNFKLGDDDDDGKHIYLHGEKLLGDNQSWLRLSQETLSEESKEMGMDELYGFR
ncbi:unnamed protein product [Cuscuta campestris]|uniref:FLZ-type domain-containing protein n=1 Tax=Cuscuta campestris TaxID=132261 RepID=A0A484M5T0_9ASTE|nr:unnamed protein product [Cuscuta campestris]